MRDPLKQERLSEFQVYYVQSINNRDAYLSVAKFLPSFQTKICFARVHNGFLDMLEKDKEVILQHIDSNNISALYFDYFGSAQIRHVCR